MPQTRRAKQMNEQAECEKARNNSSELRRMEVWCRNVWRRLKPGEDGGVSGAAQRPWGERSA